MFWKILLLVIAGLILIVGTGKIIWDAIQENPDLNVTRDLIVTIVLAFLAGLYPVIDLLRPSSVDKSLQPIAESQQRIEEKIDQFRRETSEPKAYADGIPQSENLNLTRLFDQGKEHLEKYEYEKAIKAFRAALALQNLKPSEVAALLIHVGIAQHKKNEWDPALGSWAEALRAAEVADDQEGEGAALGNLGLVYKDKGEWDKAIEFYNKALKGLEKIGDEHGMAQTNANIGILYKEQGKKREAKRLLEESLTALERIGDKPNAETVRKHLEDL